MTTIAERTVSIENVSNTVYATVDRVEKVGEKFFATKSLDMRAGTARWSREYKSKAAALRSVGLRDGETISLSLRRGLRRWSTMRLPLHSKR